MFNYTDDIKILSSYKKKSKPYGKIKNRASHGFIFRIRGAANYVFEDRALTVNEGEFIFLPLGSVYEYTTTDENDLYSSINFQATLNAPTAGVYPIDALHNASTVAHSFTELWNLGEASEKYQCHALLYDLISSILRFEALDPEGKRRYALIEPAIDYLKKNLYQSDLKINRLHRLCGISDTYFRKLFAERFGASPKEHVLTERLAHAKSIIDSGDYESITEVAHTVGYADPLYFSKAFHKMYGYPPSRGSADL